jgi:hypothetical protein
MKNTYRVKPGMRYGAHDEFEPGDVVELTEYEVAGHLDKLEMVVPEEVPAPEKPKTSKLKAEKPPASPAADKKKGGKAAKPATPAAEEPEKKAEEATAPEEPDPQSGE